MPRKLTIRTGALEAAIALHAVGNVVGVTALGAYAELDDYVVVPEAVVEAWAAALDIAIVTATALVLARLARRRVSANRPDPA